MSSASDIEWLHPWRLLQFKNEEESLPRQLALEVTEGHPLWGKECTIIGRNDSSDDFVLSCAGGTIALVHLTFQGPGDATYPRTTIYASAQAANDAMWRLAVEQGFVDDFDAADPRLWRDRWPDDVTSRAS